MISTLYESVSTTTKTYIHYALLYLVGKNVGPLTFLRDGNKVGINDGLLVTILKLGKKVGNFDGIIVLLDNGVGEMVGFDVGDKLSDGVGQEGNMVG